MKIVTVKDVSIGEGMPKICVPIVGRTKSEILNEAKRICKLPADIVELRIDWFEQVRNTDSVLELLKEVTETLGNVPLLFTFRSQREGGEMDLTFEEYYELLSSVADSRQVDMIDVETFFNGIPCNEMDDEKKKLAEGQIGLVKQLIGQLHQKGMIVVGSNHDFEKTPDENELIRRLCIMQEWNADIVKIAVMPQTERDVLLLLSATERMKSTYAVCPVITMSMGAMGIISRLSGEVFGSAITFGCAGKASAPGQMEVKELKRLIQTLHS